MGFLPLKQRVNRDKKGFATKQRMFGLLIIDEGPSLSMTGGRTVAHFKLVWQQSGCKLLSEGADEEREEREGTQPSLWLQQYSGASSFTLSRDRLTPGQRLRFFLDYIFETPMLFVLHWRN